MSGYDKTKYLRGNELHPYSCCSSLLISCFNQYDWSKGDLKEGLLHLCSREAVKSNHLSGDQHYLNTPRTFHYRVDQYAFAVFYVELNQPVKELLDTLAEETGGKSLEGYAEKTGNHVVIYTIPMGSLLEKLGVTDKEIEKTLGMQGDYDDYDD